MKNNFLSIGIIFALFWCSASTATKVALQSAQPFVIAVSRFFIAGTIMLATAHVFMKKSLPPRNMWKHILIYGLLNITIYLGLYVIGMQKISAGLGTLAVGMNPILISFMGAFFFKQKITGTGIISLLLCLLGIFIAAYPLLKTSYASIDGIIIIFISMMAYSGGAIYYSRTDWKGLDILTINGWQTIAGGIFLLPFLFFTYDPAKNNFDHHFWIGTIWLAVPVSIGAVQCWMILLKKDPVKAAYWLFLCPVFGFILARFFLNEPLSWYTAVGVLFVIGGLYMAQKFKITGSPKNSG
jgi:drug/metabolite transporter (DMT)-like permease